MRIEKDSMGTIKVPEDKYWKAQTQRSLNNFKISTEKMPLEVIQALALVKKACAITNHQMDRLETVKMEAITKVADLIMDHQLDDHFPLALWQTGSGTQSNMNVNEVIAQYANTHIELGLLHPNDDVNRSQSSNDTFPTAMHLAAIKALKQQLLPALQQLQETFDQLAKKYDPIVKVGRTHLQDATPLTLGQEISAWSHMLTNNKQMIETSLTHLYAVALGGTAVGTGINSPKGFDKQVAEVLVTLTGEPIVSSENKFHSLTSKDDLVFVHGALVSLATNLLKIVNDVRWLASGPRSGFGELSIPENEPGSSIMPGKVNPTQAEAVSMVVAQVLGNDVTINFGASQGNFQLNAFMPVIIYNFLQSTRLLADSINSFNEHCAQGITANEDRIAQLLDQSLMVVTALNPVIGYEKAAEIAKLAHQEHLTLKQAALRLNYLTEEQFDEYVDPKKMV
ncbi:MAG TPA: class II fumarate hydratase [Erysipelothrix sp.]|nr:class II fumarate hydratase [Erysipelothrix sp.]